jgi:hypothetical protein
LQVVMGVLGTGIDIWDTNRAVKYFLLSSKNYMLFPRYHVA